jgi:hypothetical protein
MEAKQRTNSPHLLPHADLKGKNVYKPKYSETYTLVKSKKKGGPRCVIKNG